MTNYPQTPTPLSINVNHLYPSSTCTNNKFRHDNEERFHFIREHIPFTYSLLGQVSDLFHTITEADVWKVNILERMAKREIKLPIWIGHPWWADSDLFMEHLPYVSEDDPSKIVYTPSQEYGQANRQVRIKPGKYLTRFFANELSPEIIRELVNEHNYKHATPTLKFTETADDVEYVYEHGPNSCMVMDRVGRYIESSIHPVRVYAGPDTRVAYIERSPGNVSARCVVNEIDQTFSRIYGDEYILEGLLRDAGYSYGDLHGCRLAYIEENHTPLCPYLDGTNEVDVIFQGGKQYLYVTSDGEHVADMTSGYLRKVYTCDCCHDRVDSEDSLVYSEWSDVNLCSFCRDSDYRYALVANYVHDYIPHSEAVYEHGEDCYFSMNYADSCDHIKYYEPTDEWMTEEHYEMYHQENEPEVEAA